MEKLFKSLLSIREIKLTTDDDYVDRLTRQYTVVMLICFAFLVSTKQFVGRPISCWCPAQFTDSHRDYANTVCWVSNTYYLPIEQTIPADRFAVIAAGGPAAGVSSGTGGVGGGVAGNPPVVMGQGDTHRSAALVSYYQWVPFILLFQAVLAATPSLLWRFFNKRSGIHLATIMDAARVCCRASYLEIREKAVRYIVNQMDRYLLAQREHKTGCMVRVKHFIAKICCLVGGRLYGNYLISAYLTIKMLYLANAVGQIFLLDAFLGSDFHLYGVYIVDRLIRGQDWSYSERFPRVTLCEFEIRHQSRVHQYVVQCALTINLFNEKIFIFLWFWYVFLALVGAVNMMKWLFRALYWPGQVQYVRKQLRAFDATHREPGILAKFTENYLRRDGMFIIRLVGLNMGEVVIKGWSRLGVSVVNVGLLARGCQ